MKQTKISRMLSPPVDFGINSTYLHAHMPKMNSSSVKICEFSCPLLAQFSPRISQLLPAPTMQLWYYTYHTYLEYAA